MGTAQNVHGRDIHGTILGPLGLFDAGNGLPDTVALRC
jgi:hypothetical protein